MKSITTNAIIDSIRSLKDKSMGLSISTPELKPEEKVYFMELQGLNVKLLIEPMDEPGEAYAINADLDNKPPSVRMRNVLYLIWKRNPQDESFEHFYAIQMERLIDYLKSKLEARI